MSGRSVSWEWGRSRAERAPSVGFAGHFCGMLPMRHQFFLQPGQMRLSALPSLCSPGIGGWKASCLFVQSFQARHRAVCCQQGLSGDLAKSMCGCLKQERPSQKKMLPPEWCQLTIVIILGRSNTIYCREGSGIYEHPT